VTDLQAANKALTLISVEPIGSLSDNGKAARTMNALLPDCKRVVLNEFPWSFATRIEPLTDAAGTPPGGYLKLFAYPTGALSVNRVYSDTDFKGVAEFRVLNQGGGLVIAANVEAGNVEYTLDIQDLATWPMQIAECLVNRLASDAATALSGDARMAISLLEKYSALARAASQTSVVEENVPPMRAVDYIAARSK
jgi:hypothetical protein